MQRWEHCRTLLTWSTARGRWVYGDGRLTGAVVVAEESLVAEWGAAGWELVSVVPQVTGDGSHFGVTMSTDAHWLYFKRPLPD